MNCWIFFFRIILSILFLKFFNKKKVNKNNETQKTITQMKTYLLLTKITKKISLSWHTFEGFSHPVSGYPLDTIWNIPFCVGPGNWKTLSSNPPVQNESMSPPRISSPLMLSSRIPRRRRRILTLRSCNMYCPAGFTCRPVRPAVLSLSLRFFTTWISITSRPQSLGPTWTLSRPLSFPHLTIDCPFRNPFNCPDNESAWLIFWEVHSHRYWCWYEMGWNRLLISCRLSCRPRGTVLIAPWI